MKNVKLIIVISFFSAFISCSKKMNELSKFSDIQKQKFGSEKTVGASEKKFEDKPYIKLNFKMEDNTVEVLLDPYMIDTYLDIEWEKEKKKEEEIKPEIEAPEVKEPEKAEAETSEDVKKILEQLQEIKKEIADKKAEKEISEKPPEHLEQPQMPKEEIIEKAEEKLPEQLQKPAEQPQKPQENIPDEVLNHIHNAQKSFYGKNYEMALKEAEDALEISETAIGYALKGSILYKMGKFEGAVFNWRKALQLNPQMTEVREILSKF